MSTELWRDGDLRRTTLGTNGFPEEHAPALPDELFLDDDRVEIIRTSVDGRIDNVWVVSSSYEQGDNRRQHSSFSEAFADALRLVREEVEER